MKNFETCSSFVYANRPVIYTVMVSNYAFFGFIQKILKFSYHIHSSSHLNQIRRLRSSQPDRPLIALRSEPSELNDTCRFVCPSRTHT